MRVARGYQKKRRSKTRVARGPKKRDGLNGRSAESKKERLSKTRVVRGPKKKDYPENT